MPDLLLTSLFIPNKLIMTKLLTNFFMDAFLLFTCFLTTLSMPNVWMLLSQININ